jgi:hypothetical protein
MFCNKIYYINPIVSIEKEYGMAIAVLLDMKRNKTMREIE